MKKVIVLILSLTFVLALAGCGKTTGSGDPVAGGADMQTVENNEVIETEQTQPAVTEEVAPTETETIDYSPALQYNEVSSVMSRAPALAEEIVKVKTDITEISELLGYDIDSCIPSAMKSYDFKYYTVTNTDTNEILSVAVDAREVGEETSRPGIRLEVGFGTRPLIDYDFYEEETVYSTINGVEVCATVVPERTWTNASGKEKTTPAVYTATFEQGENYYYIESRGALEQVIFDELVCSLVKAVATE